MLKVIEVYQQDGSSSIIWNEDFCTSGNIYRGVKSVYKYGCRTCDSYGIFQDNKDMCQNCTVLAVTYELPGNYSEIEKTVMEEYPEITTTKRTRNDNTDEEDSHALSNPKKHNNDEAYNSQSDVYNTPPNNMDTSS